MADIDFNLEYDSVGKIKEYEIGTPGYYLNIVRNWLHVDEGYLWHNPSYGNTIATMLGEPMNNLTTNLLKMQIKAKLSEEHPELIVNNLQVEALGLDSVKITITIQGEQAEVII